MDVLAASEKNLNALRIASRLGGISLKDGDSSSTFNSSFKDQQFRKKYPFEMQIKNSPSGFLLSINNVHVNITDDQEELGYGIGEVEVPLYMLNGPSYPSGIWDVMFTCEAKEELVGNNGAYRRKLPTFYLVKEGKESDTDPGISNYLNDGLQLPSTTGLATRRIGKIKKYPADYALSSAFPSAYWEVTYQDLSNDLDIYFYNTKKYFSISCSLSEDFGPGRIVYPSGEFVPSLGDYEFTCNSGCVYLSGSQIQVDEEKIGADEFPLETSSLYAYLHLDLDNLSAATIFGTDPNLSMFPSAGLYTHYLGKIEAEMISGVPIVRCMSEWQGPIYIPFLLEFAIPSGQTILLGKDHKINAVPLSTGFMEVVSSYVDANVPSAGVSFGVNFVESTECEE